MSLFLPQHSSDGRRKHRLGLWIAAGLVLAALAAGGPIQHGLTKLRVRKLVAEGEAYLAQNRRGDAIRCGEAAAALGSTNSRLNRLLLRSLAADGKPEALRYWFKLANTTGITLEDRRELLKWAVSWGQAGLAEPQWVALSAASPIAPEAFRLGAALYELKGDAQTAATLAQNALAAAPADIEARVLLGRLLLREGGPRDRTIGKRLLLEQIHRSDQTGLDVLRWLSDSGELTPFEAKECLDALRERPTRHGLQSLIEAGFAAQLRPYRREAILVAAAKEFARSEENLIELCAWLARNSALQLLTKVIPAEKAAASAPVFCAYLDALGSAGRWSEVDALLSRRETPLPAFDTALYQARAARELKQSRIAEMRWEQALELAGKDDAQLVKLADYAGRTGAIGPAERACRKLIEKGDLSQRRGYEQLLKVYQNELPRLRSTLQEMAAKYPTDTVVLNDLIYIEFLSGESRPGSLEAIRRLASNQPNQVGYRATLALGLFRAGDIHLAKATLEKDSLSWERLMPYQKAIYAAICAAAGESEKAKLICRQVDPALLKTPERELVREWL